VTGRWHQGVEAMMAAADTNGGAVGIGGNICHIHYRDLTADPLGAINGLYRHFDMDLSPEAGAAMTVEMNRAKRGGYGRNVYRFNDHGLDARRERSFFATYMKRFGIAEEIPI
ncbi:MAG TPA: sulfotransferase, partial [Acidisoma sp.]|nr:sulfotransferase [Acidisoma sp.]